MRYLMLVCVEEGVELTPEQAAEMGPATDAWVREMDGRGVRVRGDRLRPASDATTVRLRDQELLVVDGPFAETKEQIAGFDLLECSDLDEAIEVASRHPVARIGALEIRPLFDQ
ncbi:MAG TPA: YciI family protein [Acidimicrobiales bacterium]|nr:YciI family protein [Acidimicrobiales bacterium]